MLHDVTHDQTRDRSHVHTCTAERYPGDEEIGAVHRFLEVADLAAARNDPLWSECKKIPGCNLTFKIDGRPGLVCDSENVKSWVAVTSSSVSSDEDDEACPGEREGTCVSDTIDNRYDFVLLFDVQDGNPNGDPDAGSLPRIDPETGHGLVTDVCLKRKVRNYVQLAKELKPPFDIYVKEKAVLGRAHVKAFQDLGIQLGEECKETISKDVHDWLSQNDPAEGLSIRTDEDSGTHTLVVASDADKKLITVWLKDSKPGDAVKSAITGILKKAKPRRPTGKEVERGRGQMCQEYYDIRTFGAVLSLKSAPNCGQVRGPVQLTFARSIDPIVSLEHSITRMAVATEAEAEKQQGDNRTMGRKHTVPYGLYHCHGFISAPLARQTGFSTADLELFWEALLNMFEHDRSAARGQMATRRVIAFKHESTMGSAPAHKLFDLVKVARADNSLAPARRFADYKVTLDREKLAEFRVSVEEKGAGE